MDLDEALFFRDLDGSWHVLFIDILPRQTINCTVFFLFGIWNERDQRITYNLVLPTHDSILEVEKVLLVFNISSQGGSRKIVRNSINAYVAKGCIGEIFFKNSEMKFKVK